MGFGLVACRNKHLFIPKAAFLSDTLMAFMGGTDTRPPPTMIVPPFATQAERTRKMHQTPPRWILHSSSLKYCIPFLLFNFLLPLPYLVYCTFVYLVPARWNIFCTLLVDIPVCISPLFFYFFPLVTQWILLHSFVNILFIFHLLPFIIIFWGLYCVLNCNDIIILYSTVLLVSCTVLSFYSLQFRDAISFSFMVLG